MFVIVRVVSLYPLLIEILFRAGNCTNMQVPQLIPQIHTGSDILQRLKAITFGDHCIAVEDTLLHHLFSSFTRKTLRLHLRRHSDLDEPSISEKYVYVAPKTFILSLLSLFRASYYSSVFRSCLEKYLEIGV